MKLSGLKNRIKFRVINSERYSQAIRKTLLASLGEAGNIECARELLKLQRKNEDGDAIVISKTIYDVVCTSLTLAMENNEELLDCLSELKGL